LINPRPARRPRSPGAFACNSPSQEIVYIIHRAGERTLRELAEKGLPHYNREKGWTLSKTGFSERERLRRSNRSGMKEAHEVELVRPVVSGPVCVIGSGTWHDGLWRRYHRLPL